MRYERRPQRGGRRRFRALYLGNQYGFKNQRRRKCAMHKCIALDQSVHIKLRIAANPGSRASKTL